MEDENNINSTVEVEGEKVTPEVGAEGGQAFDFDSFLSALPEDAKDTFTKNGVKDLDTLSKSYKGLLEMKGKKGLVKPNEDASDEDKLAYREALLNEMGRPDEGKYEFDVPDVVADEYVSDDFLNDIADTAYKYGMSPEGFQELITKMYTAYGETVNGFNDQMKEFKAKLGEGKLDDQATPSLETKADLQTKAKEKLREAMEARAINDYSTADRLQKEYQALLAKAL